MEPIITIELKNIIWNFQTIKNICNKNVIAVIKDNAYGHGLIKIAQTLSKLNPLMLCVSSLSEAITLRKNMIFTPILLLGAECEASLLYSFKITPSISSLKQLKTLSQSNLPIPFHLEIETGMNRLGISLDQLDEVKEILKKSKLKMKGIFTHFCSQDYMKQAELFQQALKSFSQEKLIIHCQATSTFNNNFDFTNCIRVGLALYGYSPYVDLKPALKFKVPVLRCNKIKKGEAVGYDFVESPVEDGYIITLPLGYSSCLSRLKKLCFIHQDEIIYQCGKACMDLTMFFSKHPIEENTIIELFSLDNIKQLTSLNNETIYYLLSSLNPLLKRIYQ